MPRDGLGQYAPPAGTHGIPNYTVESARYNTFVDDITLDLNTARSVASGGTGATLPDAALDNLSAEKFKQVVVDWDANVWRAGSYYAASSATGISPIGDTMVITTPHAFAGIAYYANATDFVVEAVDLTDALHPRFMRVMAAGVWGAWVGLDTHYVLKSGDVMTGNLQLSGADPVLSLNKQASTHTAVLGGAMAGKPRWTVQLGNATAEAGSNAGSDFSVDRYDDAGATRLGTPIAIERATGKMTIAGDMAVTGASSFTGNMTLTGNFGVSGNLTVPGTLTCGPIVSSGTSRFIDHVLVQGTGQPCFAVWNPAPGANQAWGFWVDPVGPGGMLFGNTDGFGNPLGAYMRLGVGALVSTNDACSKPTGGPWAAVSDARIKTVTGDYESGLAEVLQLHPVRYTFKNNVSAKPDSDKLHAFVEGKESIGFVAQEVETVMPEMVTQGPAYIDGAAVTDLRTLDTGPLIFALVNAVKELTTRLEALEV
jgi:hypothetical protein